MSEGYTSYATGVTLGRFIKNKQMDFPFASGELSQLIRDIGFAAKAIHRDVNKAGLSKVTGSHGNINIQGESQQKLDVIADRRMVAALTHGGEVCAVLSEEQEEIIHVNAGSNYIVALDPLDGSSNIDVNVSIGTIFSIYRRRSVKGGAVEESDILQKGLNQVAAGYVIYGSSTMLVYTTGHGVNGFTYDPGLGEFILSHKDIQCPENGNIYSVNEGAYNEFSQGIKDYILYCKDQRYKARYTGSLVADFHRNLLQGGIYLYPGTSKAPAGKIRLMYESNALAFLAEQSGAAATDGTARILDILPSELHQRSALYIGSKLMVEKLLVCLNATS